jgi:hypothetical protein
MLMFNSTLPKEVQLAVYKDAHHNRMMASLDKKLKAMGAKEKNTLTKALVNGAENYLKQN